MSTLKCTPRHTSAVFFVCGLTPFSTTPLGKNSAAYFSSVLSKLCFLIVLAALSGVSRAAAVKSDTIINEPLGTTFTCTFTANGITVLECPKLKVVKVKGKNQVTFPKPTVTYDKVVYYVDTSEVFVPFTPEFLTLKTEDGSDIGPLLLEGMEFPILSAPAGSLFDVDAEIDLLAFIAGGSTVHGTFMIGDTLNFVGGLNSDGFDGLRVPGYSGSGIVSGFNVVSVVSVPEPATLALLGLGLAGLGFSRRKKAENRGQTTISRSSPE